MGKMASLSRFNSLIARNVMFFVYGTENMLVGQSVRLVKKIISNLLISTSIGGVASCGSSFFLIHINTSDAIVAIGGFFYSRIEKEIPV